MADTDQTLKILLQVQADVADLQKVKTGLAEVQAQAAEISGGLPGQTLAIDQAALNSQLEREASLRTAMLATEENVSVVQAATAESSLLVGSNLKRAGNEALIFATQIADGNIRMQTLASLGRNLGTYFAFAGIAGFAVFEALKNSGAEQAKMGAELDESSRQLDTQIKQWDELAGYAKKFADVVSIGEKGITEMTHLMDELDKAQKSTLSTLDKIVLDSERARKTPGLFREGAAPIAPQVDTAAEEARLANILKAAQAAEKGALATKAATDAADQSTKNWEATPAEPPPKALDEYTQKMNQAQQATDAAKAKRDQLLSVPLSSDANAAAAQVKAENAANDALEAQRRNLKEIIVSYETLKKRAQEYTDGVAKSKDETKLLNDEADHNDQAVIADKVAKAYDEIYKTQLATTHDASLAKSLATEQSDALGRQLQAQLALKGASAGTKLEHQELEGILREEALHLAAIKGLMQAVDSDPFATVFQKAAIQAQLIPLAIRTIQQDISVSKAQLAGGLLDPSTYEQVHQKILQDELELIKLGNTAKTLSFGGTLRADLISWANQFGTTAHQIAGLITNTIGSAINGLSSGISGLIFHTQTLGQAALQFGEQFVQSLINVGLQMVAQHILGASSAAQELAQGPAIAAAYAPAAAAVSIASYGAAAVSGQIAADSAIANIIAALTGASAFDVGGYTGDGARLAPAGIVHRGEYVHDAQTVRRAGGPAFFDNLRVAINGPQGADSGAASGRGRASSSRASGGETHNFFFLDWDQMMQAHRRSTAHKKNVIQIVNDAGGHLRS